MTTRNAAPSLQAEEAEQRSREWQLALVSLTPGGSEFADDPAACVAFVREARERERAATIAVKRNHIEESQRHLATIATLRAALPTWIPVEERLPEERHAVLVWCPERMNKYAAYLSAGKWRVFGAWDTNISESVSHWQPLPDSPAALDAKEG